MSNEIIEASDLTLEAPTDRAVFYSQLEKVDLEVKTGWLGGGTLKLAAQVHAGSPQSTAMTTFLLVASACITIGVASVIGAPAMAALIVGLCVPVGTYTLVRFISGRWTR